MGFPLPVSGGARCLGRALYSYLSTWQERLFRQFRTGVDLALEEAPEKRDALEIPPRWKATTARNTRANINTRRARIGRNARLGGIETAGRSAVPQKSAHARG